MVNNGIKATEQTAAPYAGCYGIAPQSFCFRGQPHFQFSIRRTLRFEFLVEAEICKYGVKYGVDIWSSILMVVLTSRGSAARTHPRSLIPHRLHGIVRHVSYPLAMHSCALQQGLSQCQISAKYDGFVKSPEP